MQLATIRTPDGTRAVRREGELLIPLDAASTSMLLARDDWQTLAARDAGEPIAREAADLAPPVAPIKTLCVGLNYRDHILEMGRDLPTHPTLFSKFPDALIGPNDPIALRSTSAAWDYEVELGVVIGRHVDRDIDEPTAAAAIAGYTIVNDVSARDWQQRTLQWLQGKSWDATTPVGPWVTTADQVDPDGQGQPDLEVSCWVDDDLRQQERTSQLVFSPAELVAYISHFTRLAPGDLIATGTPGGVAAAQDPPGYLTPGAMLRTSIEGLGTCVNRCTAS